MNSLWNSKFFGQREGKQKARRQGKKQGDGDPSLRQRERLERAPVSTQKKNRRQKLKMQQERHQSDRRKNSPRLAGEMRH